MKKILVLLTSILSVLGILTLPSTAQADGYPPVLWWTVNGTTGPTEGWWQARYNKVPLCVGEIPFVNDYEVLAPINAVAHMSLLYTWDQCWWWGTTPNGPVPHISINNWGGDIDTGGGVSHWVQVDYFSNRTIQHATIHYDPDSYGVGIPYVWAHEFGHALGLSHPNPNTCDNDYHGFMNYCNFWGNEPYTTWWQYDDEWVMWNAWYWPA